MIIDLKSVVCIILFSYCYSCLNNTELLAERSCFISNNNNNNDRLTAFDPGQPG